MEEEAKKSSRKDFESYSIGKAEARREMKDAEQKLDQYYEGIGEEVEIEERNNRNFELYNAAVSGPRAEDPENKSTSSVTAPFWGRELSLSKNA